MAALQVADPHHHHRHHRINGNSNRDKGKGKVCIHWLKGRCNRYPCPFSHSLVDSFDSDFQSIPKRRKVQQNPNGPFPIPPRLRGRLVWTNPATTAITANVDESSVATESPPTATSTNADARVSTFSLLTTLLAHNKAVSGIAMPSGSDKLFSASKDGTLRVWDSHDGKCLETFHVGGEVSCMIVAEGPWLFIGIPNAVKAWNMQTSTSLCLDGPIGQVNALEYYNHMLFAATQDGSILAWRFNSEGNCFVAAPSLICHQQSVIALVVGRKRLYSASMDHTIVVWDLTTLQCIQTLTGHTSPVMSMLCWEDFLLSGSLDQTIKVWACTESGNIEVIHTCNEQQKKWEFAKKLCSSVLLLR